MSAVPDYGRRVLSGTWVSERPEGSSLTWGRLAASWLLTTLLVASVFAALAAGGFLGAVAVALLLPLAQVAVVFGLVDSARTPRKTS